MNSARTLTIAGIKHSGKSTLGRLLAAKINAVFYDVDEVIAQKYGQSVRELFRSAGEQEFRRIEAETARLLAQKDENKVISLGGGAVSNCFFDAELFAQLSPLVMVDITDETAEKRVFANGVPAYLEKYSAPRQALREINSARREKMHCVCTAVYLSDESLSPEKQAERFYHFLEQEHIL